MDTKKIKAKIAKRVKKLNACLESHEKMLAKDRFLEKFILCETICKDVIMEYYKEKKIKKATNDLKLDMNTIPRAMKLAEYSIPHETLNHLFGALTKRGEKSAKKLRDGIVHAFCIEDIDEVINRSAYLHQIMDNFLNEMKEAPAKLSKHPKQTAKKTKKQIASPAA